MGPRELVCWIAVAASLAAQRPRPAPEPPAPAGPVAPGSQEPPARARGRGASDEQGPRTLGFEEIEQQEGQAGDVPPLVMRADFSVASVDLDARGRSRVDLAGLCATEGGFALFASDERDGGRTHFVRRFDAELAPRGEAVALDPNAGGLGQFELSPANSPEGRLAAVWLDADDRLRSVRGAFLDVDDPSSPGATAADGPIGFAGVWKSPLPAGGDGAAVSSGPVLALAGDSSWLAWTTAGRVVLRDLDLRTAQGRGDRVFGRLAQPATSAPRIAIHDSGELAIAYESARSIFLDVLLTREEAAHVDLGLGRLCGLAADPVDEQMGWWVLVRRQGALRLAHLDRGGAPDRPEVELEGGAARAAELAASPLGLCVLIQPPSGGLAALWCDDGGVVARTELTQEDATVLAARVALGPRRAAFAWTERAAGPITLRVRGSAARGESLGEPLTVDGCSGCAVQREASVAFAGELGVAVWSDQRFDLPCVGARGFTAGRTFAPRETFLPAAAAPPLAEDREKVGEESATAGGNAPSAAARRPAVALLSTGRGLVAWLGVAEGKPTVLAQVIDVDGQGTVRPAGEPFVAEPEPVELPITFPPAVLGLRDDAGFVLAWVRASPGTREEPRSGPDDGRAELRVLRVGASGRAEGTARTIGRGSRLAHPALTTLDDGRVVVAWDEQPRARSRRLAARVLDARGFDSGFGPGGRTLAFETMWRDSDHSPALAPADGGFAMAWVSGEDPDSDVFARVYDADGRPLSRPLALSTRAGGQVAPSLARATDGSHVVVWQDDLSRSSRLVGRRFVGRTRVLGPSVRFAFGLEPTFVDAARPSLVALPGGALLLVGDHAVRGRGREVGLCRVAAGWDQVEGR